MPAFILDLVKLNENLDYTIIIPCVLGYVLLFWLLVCFWVYTDTRKRIVKRRFAFIFFFLNLIFGIPFLMLYILARPYDKDESEQVGGGSVNIPIVNLIGKDGLVMAIELKMNPGNIKQLAIPSNEDAHLKIDVSLDTVNSEKFEIASTTETAKKSIDEKKTVDIKPKKPNLLHRIVAKLNKPLVFIKIGNKKPKNEIVIDKNPKKDLVKIVAFDNNTDSKSLEIKEGDTKEGDAKEGDTKEIVDKKHIKSFSPKKKGNKKRHQ